MVSCGSDESSLGVVCMPAFRRVDARLAGPQALGILVPPGRQTVVILRPRALSLDLLPLRPGLEQVQPAVFCALGRDEAAGLARRAQDALVKGAGRAPNPVEVVGSGPRQRYGVAVHIEGLLWIACQRTGGQAYEPAFWPSMDEATALAALLTPVVWPATEAGQEFYFNTQAFSC
jgi:hypothetical protein